MQGLDVVPVDHAKTVPITPVSVFNAPVRNGESFATASLLNGDRRPAGTYPVPEPRNEATRAGGKTPRTVPLPRNKGRKMWAAKFPNLGVRPQMATEYSLHSFTDPTPR